MKPVRKPIARGSGLYCIITFNHCILVALSKGTKDLPM